MNDDTNKELEQVQNIDNNVVNSSDVANTSQDVSETGVVSEVSFDYKDEEVVKEEVESAPVLTDAQVSTPASLEEVSVSGDNGFLDSTEATENSVFNEKKEEENVLSSMKEGGERAVQKKGFPYGMLIVVGLVIIFVFSMDFIAEFIEKEVINKEKEIIEEKEKSDSNSLENTDSNKDALDKKDDVASSNNSLNEGK
jgi:Na+-transporting methylmalonyl-CoA/oxaloacetate decarboxylase gamma subunit